jgi:hypothetical protein
MNGKNIIENNRIYNVSGFHIQIQDTGGRYWTESTVFRNNLLWDGGGIYIAGGVLNQNTPHQVYNNIIFRTGSTFCHPWWKDVPDNFCQLGLRETSLGIMTASAIGNLIANNTMYNLNTGIFLGFFETFTTFANNTCVNCLLTGFGNSSMNGIFEIATGADGTGDVFANNVAASTSTLVNPSGGNFQLASGSNPLVNTGTSAPSGVFIVDATGTTRGQEGGQWDIGACERFSGASSCPNFQGTTPPTN